MRHRYSDLGRWLLKLKKHVDTAPSVPTEQVVRDFEAIFADTDSWGRFVRFVRWVLVDSKASGVDNKLMFDEEVEDD